jgi:hypothetical protein
MFARTSVFMQLFANGPCFELIRLLVLTRNTFNTYIVHLRFQFIEMMNTGDCQHRGATLLSNASHIFDYSHCHSTSEVPVQGYFLKRKQGYTVRYMETNLYILYNYILISAGTKFRDKEVPVWYIGIIIRLYSPKRALLSPLGFHNNNLFTGLDC